MNNTKKDVESQIVFFTVYVLWCNKIDMHYVGVTSRKVTRRIRQHRRGKQFVDREIQRIGWENFDWWVVEENVPSNRITEREQRWIAFFDCVYPKGYNKTCGGISKITVSDDTREILRQKALARDMSGENNPHYGKTQTDETKEILRQAQLGKTPWNKGIPCSEEQKANLREKALERDLSGENNPFYGKHHTSESNEKNRQAHLGKPSPRKGKHHTEKTKAILRAKALARNVSGENNPFYGKHHTSESNEKNRQAQLGKPAWNKGKKMTEEQKAKMRAKRAATIAAKRAAKAVAEENLFAANSTPTSLSILSNAVIFQQGLRS
ncbi:MAG: GIY-YIG nuclease family protein [Selenomonadaceae bacterium]|nr:GIY-YIG nuclease family protein [Selenomonadaceae bacterium]